MNDKKSRQSGKNTDCTVLQNNAVKNSPCEDYVTPDIETDELAKFYSMKFPKPKHLVINEYPDLDITQPELLRQFVQNYVHPKENSYMDRYISRTIEVLKQAKSKKAKEKARKKALNNNIKLLNTQNISVNSMQNNIAKLGHELFFIVCHVRNNEKKLYMPFKALTDTGASNSLLHTSVANKLGIKYEPIKLILATATGHDDTAVKGIAHLKFRVRSTEGKIIATCANFIISSRLNGLEAILGNEFLFRNKNVKSISLTKLEMFNDNTIESIEILSDKDKIRLNNEENVLFKDNDKYVNLTCKECGNASGQKWSKITPFETIELKHSHWDTVREELPEADSLVDRVEFKSHSMRQTSKNGTSQPNKEKFDETEDLKSHILDKPSSLSELQSRLAPFQNNTAFIPYLKHIVYPLQFLLCRDEFMWGPTEEMSWQLLKAVESLNLRLTTPEPGDNLVLITDVSKVAASACLFREINGKLELAAINSKYFSVTDLNKCPYILEAIALGFGLKCFASHILNCTGKVLIFTDAKSLIYAKRNSNHSMLLNSTLNFLQNCVSLINVEIYHIPGTVNVLADIMSRAISDKLSCALSREDPISKDWAKVLPPQTDNLNVTRKALFEFLTRRLEPEPKTVQELYDMAQKVTPEEKYYSVIQLLDQWDDEHIKKSKANENFA